MNMNECPECGKKLGSDAIQGICPECLMKVGLGSGSPPIGMELPSLAELRQRFPQLEILELLGRGGMGAVYKARQKQLDRVVAVKILPPGIGHDPAFAERFAHEAKALAKLNHPNIVTLHEFGQAGGLFYFVMEYVDGLNLRQLLNAGRIAPREALAIVPQICDALQYAHDAGIVHRDIKPENILLDRLGRVKVADFGLAKLVGHAEPGPAWTAAAAAPLTEGGKVIGTPQYMAPEQTDHPSEVDHRADIYSLGVVFYQMLTGELPGRKLEPPSKKVVIDVRLDEVVLRALEQQPERRYQQVSQVKTMVETIVGEGRKQESEVRSQKSEGARGQVSGVRSASPTEHGGRPPRKWYTLVGDYRGTRIIHWDRILLAGYVFFAVLFVFLLIPFALAKNMPPSEPVLGMTLLASVAIVAIGMTGFVRRQLRVPVERLPQFDALPWYVTWQKLMQPPLVRDIHEHMTAAEKRALLMFNLPGMLFFFALCVPMGLYANAPNAGRLMTASFCLVAAYALINLWRGLRWKFYCSTAWARQQGITPEKIKADVGASWGEDVTPSGKARRRRRWYGAAVAAVMAFMAAALISTVRHANHPPDAADRPDVLRKLPTAEVILAGVAKPEVPWAWQELGRRQLSTNEVARIFDGLTAWIRGTSPDEHRPPLNWADEFLRELDRRGLVTDGETVGLMEAIHGSPRCPPALRIREGQTNVALQCEWANPWERERVGLTIQNELRSVTVDGQPATAWRNDWNSWKHWQFSGKVTFPILAPGKHAVKMEVLTALAASDDLVGLADQAPSTEWPRARKRWVRTATTELIVYPRDAEMVSLTRDPALDPRQPGKMALSIKRIIIRPKGERLEAVVVPNIDREMLPVSVSFDAELRVAGRALPCEGQLWAIKAGPNAAVNDAPLTAELDRLDPAVRDAHVLLTPNPKPLERFPAVDRIWGEQMGFSQVPLMRQDLPGGPTNEVVRHDALNATVDMAFQPRGPWIAGTGDGATVELLGVATAAGANAPCWRPNGEAFDQPLPEQGVYRDNSGNFDTPRSNEVRRVFITRVKNTTPNSYGLDYDVQPHSGMQGPSTLTSRAATNGVMVLTFEAMIPDTNRTATVRVGIGSGPWQTGALVQQNESGEVTGLTSGSCGSLSRAVETKDGVVVFSLDRMLTEQIRVLAVLRDHREVEAQLQPDGGFGEERPLTATFPGLTLKQILEIRLEHRPYDWVTFRNVALHSGLTEQDKAPFVEPPIDLRPWLFIVSIIGGVVLLLGIAAWKSRLGKVASLALIVMAVGLVPLAFVVYRMASDRGRVSDAEIAKRATAFVEDLRNGRVAEAHARLDWTLGFRWTDPELRRWWQSQALSYGPLQSIRILQVDHGPLNMRRVTLRCDGEKRDYGLRLSFFPTGEIEGIKTLRLDVPDLAPTKAAPAGPEAMGTPARPPEVPVSPVGQTRLSWMGWALFLSAPLSWFVVRRILRSRSPRRGPALALCIPLLALQAFAIIVICRFVAKVIVDFHANPSALNNPNVHPAFMTRLGNTLFQHPDFPSIAGGAIAVVLGILIVRAVSHATNKPAAGDAPQASPPAIPLAASASRFGKLALMLSVGAVCLLAVGLSLRAIRPTLPGAAVLELTAFVFGILGWKSRAGKAAVILLLLQPPFAALLWPLVQMPAAHAGSRATPTVHYEVFEIETAQADALVPADQRQSGFSENWQVARVTPGTIQALLNALVSEPVLMVDRKLEISNLGTRSPTYVSTQKGSVEQQQKVIGWALKADNWGYSRQDNRPDGAGSYEVNGSGWFGLRRADGQFLARVEQTVNIRIEARPPVVVNLEYEGPAPTSDAWAFFIPFTRSDNSTRYVVLTVEADESGGRATAVQRSLFPQAAHIGNAAGTVLVHHDGVDVHYVLFATNAVGSSTSDSYNTRSLAWTDHGSFKLTERLTFGYHRESTDPLHLQINGQEYDLRQGRVIVLREDGTAQQLKLFPPLAVAREPAALAKLLASSQREPEPLALTFGPATNGLQAAVELTTSNGVFRLGEPIEVVFHIRNSSSERRFLTGASWRQGDELMVEDQRGQKIEVHNITQLGATPIKSEYLLPGWTAVFHSASLAFLPEEASEKQVPGSVGYYVKVKPGKYTIRFRLHFAADKKNDADWQGDLETAPVTVDVKAAAVSAPPLVTTMPTPAAATSELAAPPQLRFLAWQDEAKEWPNGRTWHADGTPVTDSRELWLEVSVSPTRNRIENNPELVKEDPRFLHLWFSHPSLDNRSYARVALLDAAGNPLPLAAAGQVGSSSSSPSANSDQLGWITYTLSPGAVGHTPTTATVRLAYSVGPWGMDTPIEPDYRGVMGLPGNATLAGIGENVAGKAFISIAEETVAGVPAMQLSFTARTTDGRELASPSHIVGGPSAGPRMEQFEFDAPLSTIKEFHLRARPIRTAEYRDVTLRLSASPNSGPESAEPARGAAASAVSSNLTRRGTFTGTKGETRATLRFEDSGEVHLYLQHPTGTMSALLASQPIPTFDGKVFDLRLDFWTPATGRSGFEIVGQFRIEQPGRLTLSVWASAMEKGFYPFNQMSLVQTESPSFADPDASPRPPTPHLQFRLVAEDDDSAPADEFADPNDQTGAKKLRVRRDVLFDETAVVRTQVTNTDAGTELRVKFTKPGWKSFAEVLARTSRERLAVLVDGEVRLVPEMRATFIHGNEEIGWTIDSSAVAEVITRALTSAEQTTADAPAVEAPSVHRIGLEAPHLQFRLVAEDSDTTPADELADPSDPTGAKKLRVLREVLLDETAVAGASVTNQTNGTTVILLTFTPGDARTFAAITRDNIMKRLAIVFDGKLLSAPCIREQINGGRAQISGTLSDAEAAAIVAALNAGKPAAEHSGRQE